jgi:AcrR family transcriptional regulator
MSREPPVDKRSERGRVTRDHIIGVATRLFAEHGYAATSTEMVLEASSVSRGALYHHFAGKEALFTAVLEAVEANAVQQVAAAAASAPDALSALGLGCKAWLKLALNDEVRRIALIDAPSVIGWEAWRDLDNKYALGLIKTALKAGCEAGWMTYDKVDMYAHLLLAMLSELALLIARADKPEEALSAGLEAIEQFITRMFQG